MVESKLKIAFKNYYKSLYGRLPSAEMLDSFQSFALGKNSDKVMAESVCGVSLDGIVSNRIAFRHQYEFVYDVVPTEEQLDVFIAFRIGALKNDKLLVEICAKINQGGQPVL